MEYRAQSPRRAADETNTRIVNEFLDRNFYTEANGFSSVERVYDKPRQVQGIDVEFDFNGKSYAADEKAATSYVNKNLGTFSFELAFVNRKNEIVDGWLLNEDILTDSYVIVWIDNGDMVPFSEDTPDIEVLDGVGAIHVADVALVKKKKVLEYLESLGWPVGRLSMKCDKIIEKEGEGIEMGNVWRNGCKFSYSKHLVEEPVNIILPRFRLIEMADFHLHFDNR